MSSARTVVWTVLCTVVLELCGCAGGASKPTPAKAALVAASDVNPDIEGHPAPIVVRVYELKEAGAFNGADYFRLIDKEQEALGPTLVSREEYELQPGESRTWELKIPPEAHFVGAAAGFRDLPNSRWKAVSPAPRKGLRTRKLTISVAKSTISIVVGK
ncbi:MAG: putative type secretion lipoprotein family [Gammaproteobacteria bacterium]|nr:putative type secretion lipoprotein family [Gammaproteobacteria bacterium]